MKDRDILVIPQTYSGKYFQWLADTQSSFCIVYCYFPVGLCPKQTFGLARNRQQTHANNQRDKLTECNSWERVIREWSTCSLTRSSSRSFWLGLRIWASLLLGSNSWAAPHLFWLCWVFVAVCMLFPVVAHGLSCPMACGIFVPQPKLKPTSPLLEDGFWTTEPLG